MLLDVSLLAGNHLRTIAEFGTASAKIISPDAAEGTLIVFAFSILCE